MAGVIAQYMSTLILGQSSIKWLNGRLVYERIINLNTLVTEPVNFIKMDIEGAEVSALIGADKVFKNSKDIRCAICAYHRHGDEEKNKYYIKILWA